VNPQKVRLILAAVLFAAWMGYLSYLVYALPKSPNSLPIVLSRPQILVSEVDVIGTVNLKDKTVKVQEVLYPDDAKKALAGEEIKVANLDEIKPPLSEQGNLGPCLIPLQVGEDGLYHVAHVPPSPGYSHGDARIYPATGETRAEYRTIRKP
jgi:hypothetical protein